jgi:hypothetical protein
VGDSESDWIGALLVAVGGFATLWLISDRLPTMAALWHLDNVGLIVWIIASGMVVFSARHMLRMWHVWVAGLLLAPVTPFLLVTAQFGGTDTAITMTTAALGALAVFLATRWADLRSRLLITVADIALSAAAALLLAETSLYLRVLLAAGVVPVLVVLAAHRLVGGARDTGTPAVTAGLPRRRLHSYIVLILVAAAMLWAHLPMTRPAPVAEAPSDWVAEAALDPIEDFDFITDFLGPDATFTRYRALGGAGEYQTVVDVMSAPSLGRLQDFSDAVWYPSASPVNYQPYDVAPAAGRPAPAGIQTAHSDADAAQVQGAPNWNAVTWIWRSGNVFQRVTVVTSQSRGVPAPAPRPLTVHNVVVEPALWITRQQQLQAGALDPIVAASTNVVVQRLLAVAAPQQGATPVS